MFSCRVASQHVVSLNYNTLWLDKSLKLKQKILECSDEWYCSKRVLLLLVVSIPAPHLDHKLPKATRDIYDSICFSFKYLFFKFLLFIYFWLRWVSKKLDAHFLLHLWLLGKRDLVINIYYLLLHTGFLSLRRAGATLCCGARASHCGGFSCCGARALGTRASVVVVRRLSSCGART